MEISSRHPACTELFKAIGVVFRENSNGELGCFKGETSLTLCKELP